MGGVNNHIKALKLHPFKIKGSRSLKALKFKHLKYTGENTDHVINLISTTHSVNKQYRTIYSKRY